MEYSHIILLEQGTVVKNTISKYDWLNAFKCRTKGWLQLRVPEPAPSESDRFRMEQGTHVGNLAHDLFPNGILVKPEGTKTTFELTQALIQNENFEVIFEAAFQHKGLIAKADILEKTNEGLHVLEVKSSFSNSKNINNYIDDLAYTVMVIQLCGLPVIKASLVLLSRDYQHGNDTAAIFESIDKTEEAISKAQTFMDNKEEIIENLFSETQPSPALISACRSCFYFDTECIGHGMTFSVLDIPNLHHTKVKKLSEQNLISLQDFPNDISLNESQEIAKNSMLNNQVSVDIELLTELQKVSYPCYYLDFETVSTVLPLYEGHKCHQQVLTQYSIHSRNDLDGAIFHAEYLSNAKIDSERQLAENLIQVLGKNGSIFVYSSFEKTRIEKLASQFSDLSEQLLAINNRLVDLMKIIKNHVYHPLFKGSYSIKKVLPALVPNLSYENLDIANGDMAIAMFAKMVLGEVADEAKVRKDLLEYCEMDTYAMVKLHDALHKLAS